MKNVKDLLEAREESYASLGEKIGITPQCLCGIAREKHVPSFLTIKKICRYFGEDWKEYVSEEEAQ